MAEKVKGGTGIGPGELDDLGGVVRSALCVGRTGLPKRVVDRAGGDLHLLDAFLGSADVLLGQSVKDARYQRERHDRAVLGFRFGVRFFRIGLIHRSSSFQSKLKTQRKNSPAGQSTQSGSAPRRARYG